MNRNSFHHNGVIKSLFKMEKYICCIVLNNIHKTVLFQCHKTKNSKCSFKSDSLHFEVDFNI
uniref:Uncharacterized protein n=1 Tax=Anguilla anguilla TaxID=7936 RepID=A0A0E9X6Z1_ANGAN